MYEKIEGGSIVNIQGLDCSIPPEGYVYNIITKNLEWRGVYKRAESEDDQYWERLPYPSWYHSVAKQWDKYDKAKKDDDPPFYDERLEEFKAQEWDRRLNGFWFYNKGKAQYITGFHYYYLQYWHLDTGAPKFRIPDLEKAYFMQYCLEDPLSMGMVEVTKRRFGKSYWAGAFIVEYITRTKMTNGGIQSKTGTDAKKFFGKTVVNPFRKLPKFFRPVYDTSLGPNPKTEMRFQRPNVRGKKGDEDISDDELGSLIDHASSDKVAYDGQKQHRYVADECGKCFGKGTEIRMWDGSIKKVEEIDNGEFVMGDDSTPRLVYGKTCGEETMYRIIPNKGKGFDCNESHILSLSVSDRLLINGKRYNKGEVVNISVKEYLNINPVYYKCLALYKVGWEYDAKSHLVDPYMLGVWLGDGRATDYSITSTDNEIINEVHAFAAKHNLFVRVKEDNISYHVTSRVIGYNPITKELRRLGVLKDKDIPKEYLIDSRQNRLELLAGLLDTDGHLYKQKGSTHFEIIQKSYKIASNILELCLSLGFYTSMNPKMATMKRRDGSVYKCPVYRISIFGDLDCIPTRVERKKAIISRTKNRRNPLKTGFKIEKIGKGEYYGFAVNGNHLFLLADGTVVHNTVEEDVYERHEVVRYCLLDDEGNIIGKALYTTTVEKIDSDKNGVQDAFKLLWKESNQNERKDNGMTGSGLYRFFMSAKKTRNIDKYGYPDEEKTLAQIMADRESVKNNTRSLNARIRKEPLSIEEAFMEDAEECIFDTVAINHRLAHLSQYPVHKRYILFYRDVVTQKVKWRDVDIDKNEIYWSITPSFPLNKENNKFYVGPDGKMRMPACAENGTIGIDGYSNTQGGKEYGSKLSGWIYVKYDLTDPDNTGRFVGHIYGRPDEKDDLHDQILLAAEFLGYPVYYEHVADDYYTYYKNRGRLGYLAIYPKIAIDPIKLKKEKVERHRGMPTTEFAIAKQNDVMVSYIKHHCDRVDYVELLEDALKYRTKKRTPSDRTVSAMITLVGSLEVIIKPPPMKKPLVKLHENPNYSPKGNSQNGTIYPN